MRSALARSQFNGHHWVSSRCKQWIGARTIHYRMIVAIYRDDFVFSVVLPIKIWNSNRQEKKLEQQQLHLNEARLAALSRQINPHFLFNTLNSVAALIRSDPNQARQVVYKLSKTSCGDCCGSRTT